MFDLIIIGGGPAGYVAAERAGHSGLSVILFEANKMGGVCLNEGCIPTKTLLYSAKLYEATLQANKYGVYVDNPRFDFEKIMARKNKIVRKLTAGVEAKMKLHNVTIVKGKAFIKGKNEQGIVVACEEKIYYGANLLICNGSKTYIPPIPGLAEAKDIVLTSSEILHLQEPPKSLIVIGGGVIGIEFASFFNSVKTQVTVVEMLPEILGGIDYEIASMLRNILVQKGITFHLQAKVVAIDGHCVTIQRNDETVSIEAEKILISTGRRPVTEGFGIETLPIELFHGGIKTDENMRTNVPHIYAAGDVTGFSLLAHTASREGEVAVNTITGHADTMRYDTIPQVVYTNPEIACVGETEESATNKGISYKIAKLNMAYAGRFVVENEGGTGLCKVLINKKDNTLLGVHLIGNPSSEMVYGACMAIEKKLTIDDIQKIIFPHPTVSEIFKETLFV